MRYAILVFISIIWEYKIYSQDSIKHYSSDTLISILSSANDKHFAEVIDFNEKINKVFIDSTSPYITAELRDLRSWNNKGIYLKHKGQLIRYNNSSLRIEWKHKVDFTRSIVDASNNLMIKIYPNKVVGIDLKAGYHKWIIKTNFIYYSSNNQVMLGYSTKPNEELKIVRAYNTLNARKIWEEKIDKRYGWRNMAMMNDSSLIIAASGITSVNLKEGLNWKHDPKIVKQTKGALPKMGYATNQNSNVFVEENYAYYATSSNVYKINRYGEFVWKSPTDPKLTGCSLLMNLSDTTLIMINTGFVTMGVTSTVILGSSAIQMFGKPYIMKIDKATGEKIFLSKAEKLKTLSAFWYDEKYIFLANHNTIYWYDQISGQLIKKTNLKGGLKYPKGGHFLKELYYFDTYQNKIKAVKNDNPNYQWIMTKDFELVRLNMDGVKYAHIDPKNVYVVTYKDKDLKIISSTDKSFIINKSNNPIASIKGIQPKLVNNKLYFINHSQLWGIDKTKLLNIL